MNAGAKSNLHRKVYKTSEFGQKPDGKAIKMLIKVVQKNMGNITKKVKEIPFYLENNPETLKELIEECVATCVSLYEERKKNKNEYRDFSDEEWQEMKSLGKFSLGFYEDDKKIDIKKATERAIESVSDGLVRIFCGDVELKGLDEKIELREGDTLTFIRLAMLSGRMW